MRLLVPLLVVAACTPAEPSQPAGPPAQTVAARADTLPNQVRTAPLEARPTRIRVQDLPTPGSTPSAQRGPRVVPPPDNPVLRVPTGFQVNVWAEDLDRPRSLTLAPDGSVLVAETRSNRIRSLRDTNDDGASDQVEVFGGSSNALESPFGMAFSGGYFVVGNEGDLRRYEMQEGQTRLQGRGERILTFPTGGHSTRNVISLGDGGVAVAVGSASNVDPEEPPRATVFRVSLDPAAGASRELLASGMRNPVGLAIEPRTGTLYATVNERDGLGDDLVPDYMAAATDGAFYGWPFAYLSADNLDPRRTHGGVSEDPAMVARTRTPDVLFQAHSAALGLAFYPLDLAGPGAFPQRYRGGAFVAMRGSWNRSRGTGYKIAFVPFDEAGRPLGHYEDFVTGFLLHPGSEASGPVAWGRPVAVLILPDGSLLFTEEMNGRIYRVSWGG